MTTQEFVNRDQQGLHNIRSVVAVHHQLRLYAAELQFTVEQAAIVIRGELPTVELKDEVIPTVRRAGVLNRVQDCVLVRVS